MFWTPTLVDIWDIEMSENKHEMHKHFSEYTEFLKNLPQ